MHRRFRLMKLGWEKIVYLTIIIIFALVFVACPQPGGDMLPDDGGDPSDPLDPTSSVEPDVPSNVTAVLGDDGSGNPVVEVSWVGNANDGWYDIIYDTQNYYSVDAQIWTAGTSPVEVDLPEYEYGDWYFWVVPYDSTGFMLSNNEVIANDGTPVDYENPNTGVGNPEVILRTSSGLVVKDGYIVGSGESVDIFPDDPGESFSDVEFEYSFNSGTWYKIPDGDDRAGLTAGIGEHTVQARYVDNITNEQLGISTVVNFEIKELNPPTLSELVDSNATTIEEGSRTNLDVTLTVNKPDGAEDGGIFYFSLDNASSWNEFSSGSSHTFSDTSTGMDVTYDSIVKYEKDSYVSSFMGVPYFTIDKKTPEFISAPSASSEAMAVEVSWYQPEDSGLESVTFSTRSADSIGGYTEFTSYLSGNIPDESPNTESIPTTEDIDIQITAVDDVGNETVVYLEDQSPDTTLDNLFVTPGGTGLGGSWESAQGDLQEAIELAEDLSIPEVWVMEGTYKPTSPPNLPGADPPFYHFSLRNGVTVIGGFAGTEISSDPTGRETVLSGNILGMYVNGGDATYHVFYHPSGTGLNDTAVLKNVTITEGHADMNISNSSTYSDHTLGGGMFNVGSSPLLIDCSITENEASKSGGAMYNSASSPTLINCYIADNETTISAADEGGAGVHNVSTAAPTFINTIFLNNQAFANGGGVYNKLGSVAVFHNCTFHGNAAGSGSYGMAVYNSQSNPEFYNTIIWNNAGVHTSPVYNVSSAPNYTSCLVSSTQTVAASDVFAGSDPAVAEDLQLCSGSAAINAGSSSDLPADTYDLNGDGNTTESIPVDFGGNDRVQGSPGTLDLGAWEY